MASTVSCPECGAALDGGNGCEEHFHQMLAWEWEVPANLAVHHLMVLAFHLQHPHLYSPEGLAGAVRLLVDFLDRGVSPEMARRASSATVDSGNRGWRIKGTPASHAAYDPPVTWTMTAADVVAGGIEAYLENVAAWARSILDSLRAAGHAPAG